MLTAVRGKGSHKVKKRPAHHCLIVPMHCAAEALYRRRGTLRRESYHVIRGERDVVEIGGAKMIRLEKRWPSGLRGWLATMLAVYLCDLGDTVNSTDKRFARFVMNFLAHLPC